MPTTPVQGLPYPALSDPANGPVAFQNLATALEDYKTIVRCTSSTRPGHVAGRICYETDTKNIIVSDGATWGMVTSRNVPYTILANGAGWGGIIRYARSGGIVTVILNSEKASWTNNEVIGLMPVGFRPAQVVVAAGTDSLGSNGLRAAYVGADGGIGAIAGGSFGSTVSLYTVITYAAVV